MYGILTWMEQSAIGHFMRESSLWTYPIVNLAHILGIASLFGAVLALDLRMLGFWRRVPLAPIAAIASPLAAAGFILAATSGVGLFATKATEYAGNPYLLIKFPAIALGLLNVALLRVSPAWRARGARQLSGGEERQLAIMGGISLTCWLTAISAGRMIAYW
jgi:hypothetical protein